MTYKQYQLESELKTISRRISVLLDMVNTPDYRGECPELELELDVLQSDREDILDRIYGIREGWKECRICGTYNPPGKTCCVLL